MASTGPDADLRPASKRRNVGTSPRAGYWLARLWKLHPDLARRVEAGELSAYAAAIRAGLRHKPDPVEELRRRAAALDKERFCEFFKFIWVEAKRRRL
jgi:hypothetical protein